MDYCESRLPLAFSRCIFSDGISLRNAIIPELQLIGCEVRKSLFPQGLIRSLNAPGAKVSSNVFLTDGFKANGEVSLIGAEISGQLICRGLFKEGLNAQSLKTSSDVFMDSRLVEGQVLAFESNGVVNLQSAEIGGQLCCRGRFEKGLTATNLKTSSDVFMDSVRSDDGEVLAFESNGDVNLSDAEIGGSLRLGGATIKFLGLNNAEVRGELVNLHNWPRYGAANSFRYQTIAYARGWKAGWKWVRDMSQSSESRRYPQIFEKLMSVHRRMISVYRRMATNGGPIWVRFALSLAVMAVSLAGFLMLISFRVIEELFHMLWSSEFSPQPYEQLMSVYRRMGHTNWARNVGFQLEKRRSKAFKGWQSLTWRPWYAILRWTIGYGYKPFRFFLWAAGLMTAGFLLFSSGHPDGIVARHTPQTWQVVSKFAPPSWQEPAFFDEAPAFLANEWIPSEGEALASESWEQNRKPPPDYLPFNPLVYSLEATFPVLNLGQLEKWHPSNRFLLGVRWACTLIGTLLLAILALFGAGVLGPRWRSGDEGD